MSFQTTYFMMTAHYGTFIRSEWPNTLKKNSLATFGRICYVCDHRKKFLGTITWRLLEITIANEKFQWSERANLSLKNASLQQIAKFKSQSKMFLPWKVPELQHAHPEAKTRVSQNGREFNCVQFHVKKKGGGAWRAEAGNGQRDLSSR